MAFLISSSALIIGQPGNRIRFFYLPPRTPKTPRKAFDRKLLAPNDMVFERMTNIFNWGNM